LYASRIWIPGNERGVMRTLELMRELANQPGEVVELEAARLWELARGDGNAFPGVLRRYLEEHTRYEDDPYNVELLREPAYALHVIQEDGVLWGDCDDVAVLGAALALAVGLPSRFKVLAWAGPLSHVYAEVRAPGPPPVWQELDVQRPPGGLTEPRRSIAYP
jgi:hypothetical protein